MKEKSTPIDRKKEISVAFADFLNTYYVPVGGYMWVSRFNIRSTKKDANDLYDEFYRKAWK